MKRLVIAAVSIAPIGEGVSVSDYVAEAIKVLKDYGRVEWELGPMCTTMWGDPRDVFEVILLMQEAMFKKGAVRLSTVIKMDERRDKPLNPTDKVESILNKLGEEP
ncbi:MAG: MTH1187 family thiamine-binding protein [Thermotogae bacterium]|nr:MTH1187 family thiamine-binding protein [Thermotogota bacterium]